MAVKLKWNYAGIKRIELPITEDEVTIENIEKYFFTFNSIHGQNRKKIDYLMSFTEGKQDILNKKRKFEKDVNNKVVQNHALAMVNFKEGFLLGDKREFALKVDRDIDDLQYLDRYLADVSFFTKDVEIKHNIYATGIGTSFIQPKTNIFVPLADGQARYKTAEEGYDVDYNSPFAYECVDSRNNFVVYSSVLGVDGLKDLFCVNISNRLVDNITRTIYTVYTRQWRAEFDTSGKYIDGTLVQTPETFRELPMIEHSVNRARMGTTEIVLDLLNSINMIVSTQLDNIVDVSNQVLVFYGCDIDSDTLAQMYEQGAICIPDTTGAGKVGLEKISVSLNHNDIIHYFEQLLARSYDIAGVPIASASGIGNGNNGAAYIGGGWINAQTIIKRDIISLESGDRELLRKMLLICNANTDSRVRNVNANQIDIKYIVNMSNDLLTKTQALQNLIDLNFDYEDALKVVGIVGDTKSVAKNWAENVERLKKEAIEIGSAEVQNTVGIEANMENKTIQAEAEE